MNWRHIKLIFAREMRDQLRDRRTLFTIVILPLLLYPLLGMLMMQMAQFNREYIVRVRVVGSEHWPASLPLLEQHQLSTKFSSERFRSLLSFEEIAWPASPEAIEQMRTAAKDDVQSDKVDAVFIIEPGFEARLNERLAIQPSVQNRLQANEVVYLTSDELTQVTQPATADAASEASEESSAPANAASSATNEAPPRAHDGLEIIANLARDHSQIAMNRLNMALRDWQHSWVASRLASSGMNPQIVEPLDVTQTDTAPVSVRRAMLWSKILPFVMLVWALTGAFYPAIDLCAGEKERGTLETLLSSPARRNEIVCGKLLTVIVFSIGSALLNLMSMQMTAGLIVKQLAAAGTTNVAEAMGPLPTHAFGWLILLLLPMSAFFSALALAVAALARSTKEGQYYLMPLMMVTLPLVSLPMIPSLELNLSTSLVPVTGAVFLIRTLIEGRYAEAITYLPIVTMVTGVCCWLSVRWAIRQFESESVMFSEADRWSFNAWLKYVWQHRGTTASPFEAVLCGVTILIAMFFAQFFAGKSINDWYGITKMTVAVQIGLVLTPAVLMAIFLTRSLRQALRIHRPQWSHLIAAVLLGVTFHPTYLLLGSFIKELVPVSPEMVAVLSRFSEMVCQQPIWSVLLLLAVLPAICEELAFRGFIFGGLLKERGVLRAVLVSALFFGFTHTLLQQSIAATIMGILLGVVAWRTGGVVCTMLMHVINNSISIGLSWLAVNKTPIPMYLRNGILEESSTGEWQYQTAWQVASLLLSIVLIAVIFRNNRDTARTIEDETK